MGKSGPNYTFLESIETELSNDTKIINLCQVVFKIVGGGSSNPPLRGSRRWKKPRGSRVNYVIDFVCFSE